VSPVETPLGEPHLDTLQAGALRMRVATQGSGPLVLLCHGFPESWRSWRSQLAALAAAGYRAAAPDMRGYGGTDAPVSPETYTLLHHVGDMTELVHALGERHRRPSPNRTSRGRSHEASASVRCQPV
jgi:pimeloyl-ACP methyl ester carboxylesterase